MKHPGRRTWGLDEVEINGFGWGEEGGDKWDFRLGKQWLCCVWCLGRDWRLTNVAWYTGYWKQGQGFLPGHEFLGWSFCLIGQLDHFPPHIFTEEDAVSFAYLSNIDIILTWRALYQCWNQRGETNLCCSSLLSASLTHAWKAQELLIL